MKRIFGLFTLTAIFAIAAFADIRLPDTPKPTPANTPKPESVKVDSTMQIEISKNEKTARLIIPRSQLAAFRAELEGLDGGDAAAAATAISGVSRAQTIAGGLFLSLAAIFGGVWFVRAGKNASKKIKIAAAGALLFLSGALGTVAFANIAPATNLAITSQIFDNRYFTRPLGLRGGVILEVAESGDRIRLIVPFVKDAD